MAAAEEELDFQWVEANPRRVNERDTNYFVHYTPLYVAVAFKESLALTLWLLDEKGADVNVLLHAAHCLDMLIILMNRGADPTRRTCGGWTPLMTHASNGSANMVAFPLKDPRVRATINVRESYSRTALHCVCISPSIRLPSTLSLLLKAGADSTVSDQGGRTPLASCQQHLRQYPSSDIAISWYGRGICVLDEAFIDAEKTSLLVKARRLVVAATAPAMAPSYMQNRVARCLFLPHVTMARLMDAQNDEQEGGRKVHSLMVYLLAMGGGPKGEGMPRDVFLLVLDFLMPSWDPLRRGLVGVGALKQG